VLQKRKNKTAPSTSFFKKMFIGEENNFELIPINSNVRFSNDSLIVEEYTNAEKVSEKSFLLADIVSPLNTELFNYVVNGNTVNYNDIDGTFITTTVEALQQQTTKQISNKKFWLGTDKFGRDMFSRLIIGVRISLSVGLIAVIISIFIGVLLGSIAGYFRGWNQLCYWCLP
jgi:peptide/nickel transport system permease protein